MPVKLWSSALRIIIISGDHHGSGTSRRDGIHFPTHAGTSAIELLLSKHFRTSYDNSRLPADNEKIDQVHHYQK